KGYWGSGNWDYVRYTNLYNAVYDAVKSVRPDAKIGGPYLGIQGDGGATIGKSGTDTFSPIGTPDWTVINYWLTNKHGADFFCFDRWLIDYHDENSYTNAERMLLTPFFGSVVAQIRAVDANLPIWISEFYGGMDAGGSPVSAFTAANHASCYYHSLINGASLALVWNPEEVVPADPRILNSLFTDTATSSGGQLTPHYNVVSAFNNYFYPGVQIYETTTSATNLEALASLDKTMLINKKSSAMTVTYGPNNITLSGYEVKVVNTPSATPGQATSPSPENNDTDVATNATLSWTAGSGATSHDVYFGTTSPGTFIGNQAGTTYNPGTLANSTTYYWRIDEKNASGTTTGVVWSFATAAPPAIFSDGFESGGFTAGGWTKQNTNATVTTSAKYTGAYGAKLAKATWMQKAVSTVGYNTIHVKYARKTSGLDTGENLYVEWSIDGSAWNNLETTQATTWASKDFTCGSGANDNANFRVRWRTNASGTNEYAYVDEVVITGTVQLFSDGFESGSFFAGGWTKENTNATVGTAAVYTGVYGARLPGITWIQKAVSTTGYNTIHVKYARKTSGLDTGENLYVEWSID
ncbi:MAG: hypothetical protein MUO27_03785, partial [Sedimentisphaerales bacterium]|nr:hypothetical protein [Sedimentisphaerales bacterium]